MQTQEAVIQKLDVGAVAVAAQVQPPLSEQQAQQQQQRLHKNKVLEWQKQALAQLTDEKVKQIMTMVSEEKRNKSNGGMSIRVPTNSWSLKLSESVASTLRANPMLEVIGKPDETSFTLSWKKSFEDEKAALDFEAHVPSIEKSIEHDCKDGYSELEVRIHGWTEALIKKVKDYFEATAGMSVKVYRAPKYVMVISWDDQ